MSVFCWQFVVSRALVAHDCQQDRREMHNRESHWSVAEISEPAALQLQALQLQTNSTFDTVEALLGRQGRTAAVHGLSKGLHDMWSAGVPEPQCADAGGQHRLGCALQPHGQHARGAIEVYRNISCVFASMHATHASKGQSTDSSRPKSFPIPRSVLCMECLGTPRA